ncbi:MAG TPA: SRPBCC family protein [Mycobacteriales bacterium]|nr:SRPBCC family protein [Mycobacteriales bacterium]
MGERRVSRSTVVAAPPDAVFALLADPRRHPDFDGSGMVRQAFHAPERLSLGAHFGMRMRLGLPYPVKNTVVEFEEGRRIAWRHYGRHVWRYELEPVPGGTRITETFDWSSALSPLALEKSGFPAKNLHAIEATLARFEELFGTLP